MRILIEVEDGWVTDVYCDDENATVIVIDHDNLNGECEVDGGSDDIDDILYQFHRED